MIYQFDSDVAQKFDTKIAIIVWYLTENNDKKFSEILTKLPFLTEKQLRDALKKAVKNGAINRKTISDCDAFALLNKQHATGCLFCGYSRSFLDKHHYPVRACSGGTETISICSNCHREFHQLTDYGMYEVAR